MIPPLYIILHLIILSIVIWKQNGKYAQYCALKTERDMESQIKEQKGKCKPLHSKKCAVARAVEIIGGKWRLPIIWELSARESMRYNELKRALGGITNIMLTRSLQDLERHGLVRREEREKIPPHVEYSLTESCKRLLPALDIINEWGREQMKPPPAAEENPGGGR